MTTFNTGNPIGSTDARDLSDNAENFDRALGTLEATWTDRLGVTRDSFEGRLEKGSFYRVGTFAAGYTLTNMRQTLEYSGHEYSWAGTFPKVVAAGATPATSGGIGAGAWVDRTDVTLRGDINIVQKRFACVADMVADTSITVGKIVETIGYYNDYFATTSLPKGGNRYEIVAAGTGTVDGGSFIALSNGLQAKALFDKDNTLPLSCFGASSLASQSTNYTAIASAWSRLCLNGGGTILFDGLYDIGANTLTLTPESNFTSKSTYALIGVDRKFKDQQTTLNKNSGYGIISSALSSIRWGSATIDMIGRGLIQNFTIYNQIENSIGLNFDNSFGSTNINCDLIDVSLIDYYGNSSYVIYQGRWTDSTCVNLKISGKGIQPFAGIYVTRELPTLISPQINFCQYSIYVSSSVSAFFNIVGGWSIYPSKAHIAFEANSVTHSLVSSATNFSMLETTTPTSTPVIALNSSGTVNLLLSGCQMDSSLTSTSLRAINFQCGGRLTLIGCKLNPASTVATKIKLGSFTIFTPIACEGFTMEDATSYGVVSINSGFTEYGNRGLTLTGNNVAPTQAKNGLAYLDSGTNTARKRAGWRFYDAGSGAYLDMHPQFESKNTLTGTPNTWVKTYMPDGTAIWLHATTTAPA